MSLIKKTLFTDNLIKKHANKSLNLQTEFRSQIEIRY